MSIVWSFIWGVIAAGTMLLTLRYYLPHLKGRICSEVPEAPTILCEDSAGAAQEKEPDSSVLLNKKMFRVLLLLACAGFAAWCGYKAELYSTSMLGMFQMTFAMMVLSIVFITDMELMIIPNSCSLMLLFAGIVVLLCKFIWWREQFVPQIADSIIALAASLLVLVFMSKITGGGLGMGDIKLFSSLGFLCGVRAVCFTLMFAFLLCSLLSTILLVAKRKKLKDALPLGPFIWLGYGAAIVLGML